MFAYIDSLCTDKVPNILTEHPQNTKQTCCTILFIVG